MVGELVHKGVQMMVCRVTRLCGLCCDELLCNAVDVFVERVKRPQGHAGKQKASDTRCVSVLCQASGVLWLTLDGLTRLCVVCKSCVMDGASCGSY